MNRPAPIDSHGNLNPKIAIYLMLSMTKRCNMRCPGCYYLQQDEHFFKHYDIGLDEAKEIVKYYRGAGVRQAIPNSEGEVLLHPEYPSLVRYIKRLGYQFKPWLTTNGIRLPGLAGFVVENIGEILISIDGSTYEKYAASRGGNEALFNKVISGVHSVVNARRECKYKPAIIINCVTSADRCYDIPDMIRLAEGLGVDVIKFTNFHVLTDDEHIKPVTGNESGAGKMFKGILSRKDYKIDIFLPSLYTDIKPPYNCRMLASIMIGSNGDFAPCCRLVPESKWGNYFTAPGKHNNEALKAFRLSVLNATSTDQLPRVCRQCAHLSPKRPVFSRERKQWYMTGLS